MNGHRDALSFSFWAKIGTDRKHKPDDECTDYIVLFCTQIHIKYVIQNVPIRSAVQEDINHRYKQEHGNADDQHINCDHNGSTCNWIIIPFYYGSNAVMAFRKKQAGHPLLEWPTCLDEPNDSD
jgi:hypothetical protein